MLLKAILLSISTSWLLAAETAGNLAIKAGQLNSDTYMLNFFVAFIIALCVVCIPAWFALKSKSNHKTVIIVLDLLCFLPFGTVLYIVSLIWGIKATKIDVFKFFKIPEANYRDKKRVELEKKTIINDSKYLDFKSNERIAYLSKLKEQTKQDLKSAHKDLDLESKKIENMPKDIAKYVDKERIKNLTEKVYQCEDKLYAIEEIIALENKEGVK